MPKERDAYIDTALMGEGEILPENEAGSDGDQTAQERAEGAYRETTGKGREEISETPLGAKDIGPDEVPNEDEDGWGADPARGAEERERLRKLAKKEEGAA